MVHKTALQGTDFSTLGYSWIMYIPARKWEDPHGVHNHSWEAVSQ